LAAMSQLQAVRAQGQGGRPKEWITSKLLMEPCICRLPWRGPELEVGTGGYHRNMLSSLLTTLLVHCKQQGLDSHEAKTPKATLKSVSRNMYTAKAETYSESLYVIDSG
jgi:hypothetical protein